MTYTFKFGTAPGCYAPCTTLTDSLFTMETIEYFMLDNQIEQNPNQNFSLGTLDLSGFTVTNTSKLKVIFA